MLAVGTTAVSKVSNVSLRYANSGRLLGCTEELERLCYRLCEAGVKVCSSKALNRWLAPMRRRERTHLVVPALEADLVQNLRTVYGVVALGAIIVGPERRVVRVLEPLVRVDKLAHLMVAHACVRSHNE